MGIATVIAGAASVTTVEGVEAVVLEKEALKKLPTVGWNPNFSLEAVVWEAEVTAEAAEIWLAVTLVIAVRTVAKANVTSVAITTTTTETTLIVTLVIVAPALLAITSVTSVPITTTITEITSIATLVIVAPALVTASATSVITITTEIMSAVTLVIVAPALVTASAASVITTTTTMADMAVAVQPLTAIPAAVPLSAVKTNVTSVITIMMVGGRHLEQVEAGVLTLETLGDQMGVKIVPEAVVQSILMLEDYLSLKCVIYFVCR